MWEDQEEDDDEDEGLAGQFLSDILSTNKYGKQQLRRENRVGDILVKVFFPAGKGKEILHWDFE